MLFLFITVAWGQDVVGVFKLEGIQSVLLTRIRGVMEGQAVLDRIGTALGRNQETRAGGRASIASGRIREACKYALCSHVRLGFDWDSVEGPLSFRSAVHCLSDFCVAYA